MDHEIVAIEESDARYPSCLLPLPGHPKTLYCLGKLPHAWPHAIAIVGTRKATSEGTSTARDIANEFSRRGISVVSGLALGIDAAAHGGALSGGAPTYAVLANGLDGIYPREHEGLAKKILEADGCLFSEYPPGAPALPHQFLERNRIISGLAEATLVIEAPERSGALATARHAVEQGKEVFVVPGSPKNRNYKGSHFLIREGARLVTGAADVLLDMGFAPLEAASAKEKKGGPEGAILEALRRCGAAQDIDSIVKLTTLEPRIAQSILASLAIEGYIEEHGGQWKLIQ